MNKFLDFVDLMIFPIKKKNSLILQGRESEAHAVPPRFRAIVKSPDTYHDVNGSNRPDLHNYRHKCGLPWVRKLLGDLGHLSPVQASSQGLYSLKVD